ncbi:MAG: rplF [Haloplasmataceae bacterium]|jgi:ribosomal protein L6P/L9E|nr:rplF [Haloplasmataceae bacterium]
MLKLSLRHSSFLYFFFFKYFFVYIERNKLLAISKLGSFKFKYKPTFLLYNNNNIFFLKYFLLNNVFCNIDKKNNLNRILFQNFISLFFVSILVGFRGKFKIVGRGYKLHKKNNNLVFKLGYSHLIFKNLDLSLFLKKKEKKKLFYTIISLNNYLITNYINLFRTFRIPNVYKKKGIFNNTKKVLFKFGKANMV